MIRLALIGCGAWGWRYIPAALEAGNCVVTHVAGVGRSCPVEGRRHLNGLQVVNDHRLLILAPVDAFIVAAPPADRLSTCIAPLATYRPVMVEKPMALTHTEALAIVAAAERAGVPLLVNHQHLFAPAYEALRDIVSGWSGKTIMTIGEGPGPHRDYTALWDYGPHDVAMTMGLMPPGEKLVPKSARTFHRDRPGIGFDIMSQSETTKAIVTVSNCALSKCRSLRVHSGDRLARYDDLVEDKLRINGNPMPISPERPLTLAVRAFAEAVRTGTTDWRFGRFGADVVGILDQAQQMLDRQREVHDAHH